MKREHDGKGNTAYTNEKCPTCGSRKRIFENLCLKAVELGAAPAGFAMPYRMEQRIIGDKKMQDAQPFGGKVPVAQVAEDICADCLTIYPIMVQTGVVEKVRPPKKLVVPGQG